MRTAELKQPREIEVHRWVLPRNCRPVPPPLWQSLCG